jgi:acetyl-CoA C-acetyltransferase
VEAIKAGYIDLILAGGTESMSNAPYLLKGARWGYRMGNGEIVDSMLHEGLTCAINGCHMGMTAEEVAKRFSVSRTDQDAFAAESQARAERAVASGVFDKEIVPVDVPQKKGTPLVVARDEYPRAATTAEKLAGLKPAFTKEGSVTAGNASGINDGAAFLVLAEAGAAREANAKPLARLVSYAVAGVPNHIMGEGPIPATKIALEKAGMGLDSIDVIESNEAFAAQAIAVARGLELDMKKVNPNGGAIALGHPVGASGAVLAVKAIHELHRTGGRYALVTMCVGGGQGIAAVFERL